MEDYASYYASAHHLIDAYPPTYGYNHGKSSKRSPVLLPPSRLSFRVFVLFNSSDDCLEFLCLPIFARLYFADQFRIVSTSLRLSGEQVFLRGARQVLPVVRPIVISSRQTRWRMTRAGKCEVANTASDCSCVAAPIVRPAVCLHSVRPPRVAACVQL